MKKTVYLIGNAHLDPVWLWRWQDGFSEIKATFCSALDRMKEFDDFYFTAGCAAYYMWIEKSDPKMFSEIAERVKEGRWCIAGGQLIQPDCNLPSGESFARHSLISQRYFKEKFGIIAKTGYNPDSFGHNGNMPQILKKSGMDNYVFMRPMKHEKELEKELFRWQSADGSSVLTYRIPSRYCIDMYGFYDEFHKIQNSDGEFPVMAFYGCGNHGGGPSTEMLDRMHKDLDETFIYSTPDRYFKDNENTVVPTLKNDDLQFHAKGCYSAVSEIKENNRKCENKLFAAEVFGVLSKKLINTEYPKSELDTAWKNVLFNQFHDVLGGCCIKEAVEDARYIHGEALSIAERNKNFALQQISWSIDTMDGKELKAYKNLPDEYWQSEENIGCPVVVFNPLPYAVKTVVDIKGKPSRVCDNFGTEIPMQLVRDSKTNCDDKEKCIFYANIPPMGYTVYRVFQKGKAQKFPSAVNATNTTLENEYLKVEFNPENGEIKAVTDKTKNEIILKDATTVLIDETDADTWAHGIKEFKNIIETCDKGCVKMTESGPVRASVRATQTLGNTVITRDYYLAAGDKKISVKTVLDFREKHKMIKFGISSANLGNKAFGEIPFGYIERPTDGTENATVGYMALKSENGGVGIATTSKYSFSAENDALSFVVLRGAIYADHFAHLENRRDEFCRFSEQGEHEFTYTLFPFKDICECTRQSQMLNNKPTAVMETFHKGDLPVSFSAIDISAKNIAVSALKFSEDNENAYLLRCYETEQTHTTAKITLFGTTFTATFTPNEIKTFIIDGENVRETDFLESE